MHKSPYNWLDVLERSFWTAVETGLGLIVVEASGLAAIPDKALWSAIGISTVIAFVKNVSKQRLAFLNPSNDIDPSA